METFSAFLAICAGNSPVPGEFPAQRPVTRSFDFFFISVWINSWVNDRKVGDLRCYRAHYDVIVMSNELHTIQQNTLYQVAIADATVTGALSSLSSDCNCMEDRVPVDFK